MKMIKQILIIGLAAVSPHFLKAQAKRHFEEINATQQHDQILLEWSVKASDADNDDYYRIEKLDAESNFVTIHTITADRPETDELVKYRYLDHLPDNGRNYYRITAVDYDGNLTSSQPILVDFFAILKERCYPNPIKDHFTIEVNAKCDEMLVAVYDLDGEVYFSKRVRREFGKYKVDLQNLRKTMNNGTYIVKATDTHGYSRMFKVIKTNKQ